MEILRALLETLFGVPGAPQIVPLAPEERSFAVSHLTSWIDLAQLVTAGAALVGVILIPLQLNSARKRSQEARTAEYQRRWLDPQFSAIATSAWGFLRAESDAERSRRKGIWRAAKGGDVRCLPRGVNASDSQHLPRATADEVLITLGFFEELGEAFNSRLVDRRAVARLFRGVSEQYYGSMVWFGEEVEHVYRDPTRPFPGQESRAFRYRRRTDQGFLDSWVLMNREFARVGD